MRAGCELGTTKARWTIYHFLTVVIVHLIWLNMEPQVGYVPRSYLEIEGLVGGEVRQAEPQGFMGAPLLQQGFSFSSVDYSSTSIDFHPLEPIPEGVTVHFPQSPPDQPKVARQIKYCRALYDFDASNKAELSFKEHDIIKVLKTKTPSGVDDGWWEGEARGRLGLFPSLAVAPIRELGVASPPLHPRVGVSPSSLFPPFPIGSDPAASSSALHISEHQHQGQADPWREAQAKPLSPERVMTGLGRLRATTEARESGHEKSSPTARVLINKIDRNYEGGANELLDDLTKLEKRLIQRVDLSEGETSGPRTPWTPPAPPPYSVIVTPATPQTPLPSRANAASLAAQPLNPKAFCLADQVFISAFAFVTIRIFNVKPIRLRFTLLGKRVPREPPTEA